MAYPATLLRVLISTRACPSTFFLAHDKLARLPFFALALRK